jgi:hypothetical protein
MSLVHVDVGLKELDYFSDKRQSGQISNTYIKTITKKPRIEANQPFLTYR